MEEAQDVINDSDFIELETQPTNDGFDLGIEMPKIDLGLDF